MAVDDCFSEIENSAFAAVANVASTLSVFLKIISSEPSFHRLREETRFDPLVADKIVERIRSLCEVRINFEYENPYDVALSAYAWVLHEVSPDAARIAAERITSASNIWWAAQVASRLLQQEPNVFSHTKTHTAVMHFPENNMMVCVGWSSEATDTTLWTYVSQGRVPLHRGAKTLNAAGSRTDTLWNPHRFVPKPGSNTTRSRWVANG